MLRRQWSDPPLVCFEMATVYVQYVPMYLFLKTKLCDSLTYKCSASFYIIYANYFTKTFSYAPEWSDRAINGMSIGLRRVAAER